MRTTVSILLVLSFSVAFSQQHQNFSQHVQRLIANHTTDSLLNEDKSVCMLQLNDRKSYTSLINQGVDVLQRVSDDLVIVGNGDEKLSSVANDVRARIKVNHLWKLSPFFDHLDFSGYPQRLVVKINRKKIAFKEYIPSDLKVVAVHDDVIEVEARNDFDVRKLILLPQVVYIGKESMNAKVESRVIDHNLNPNYVNKVHHHHPEIDGTDVVISIKEQLFDFNDIDLTGRTFNSAPVSPSADNHATDMATIAAGAGNSFITGRGVARRASLTSSTFDDLFADSDSEYQSNAIHVQNHSYGTIVETFYGTLAESYDLSANRNPTLVHVFSAGNQGAIAPPSGKYGGVTGFANLTGNSKAAKNVIVVGSVDSVGRPLSFSSRGPVNDGRIKPELVAYSMAGSSNSAALVSGLVALLQQEHKNLKGQYPPSALLKSLLINSARDVHHAGPDFTTGFGNVDAIRTIRNLQEEKYFTGSVSPGASQTFQLTVPADAVNLKITLCWNDPAASANAGIVLVNDVDLVVSNGGEQHLPWVLNTSASAGALGSMATRGVDRLNNVEQVTVAEPDAGNYEIALVGSNLISPQQFFVAYQWDVKDEFEWMFPTGSDHFPYNGETGTYFYWNSTLSSPTGRLEYSTDEGQTWMLIKDGVDLAKGYYRWDLSDYPSQVLSGSIARMVTSSGTFATEEFTISKVWFPNVGFNCGESVLLQWNALENATAYKVYALSGQSLAEVAEVTDTLFFIDKREFSSPYFAVEPLLPNGKPGLRTSAVNYNALGGCYVRSFVEAVDPDEGIFLSLEIGTTIGVETIRFEREGVDGFVSLREVQDVSGTEYQVLDEDPFQGLNRYRAHLFLSNGSEVVSDTLEVFFITQSPYVLFPNPVQRGHELRIFSNTADTEPAVFEMYQSNGGVVVTSLITSDREYLQLSLPPGSYYYVIVSPRGKFRGKIFID